VLTRPLLASRAVTFKPQSEHHFCWNVFAPFPIVTNL
jgi:hypothetical protein